MSQQPFARASKLADSGRMAHAAPAAPTAPIPPQNLDAEESVLGAMMLSPGAIGAVSEVLSASDGDSALELLEERQGRVDLLISDVVMPGMDGPTLVERARARYPDLKVLFISGYAEEQLRGRVDNSARALLRKPYSIRELGMAVRERLAA